MEIIALICIPAFGSAVAITIFLFPSSLSLACVAEFIAHVTNGFFFLLRCGGNLDPSLWRYDLWLSLWSIAPWALLCSLGRLPVHQCVEHSAPSLPDPSSLHLSFACLYDCVRLLYSCLTSWGQAYKYQSRPKLVLSSAVPLLSFVPLL